MSDNDILPDRIIRSYARKWFDPADADKSVWALFAKNGAIASVREMRDAIRLGAIPDPIYSGALLRYIEHHGERGPQREWGY